MNFIENFLKDIGWISKNVDMGEIWDLINAIKLAKDRGGRLFIIGVGGSAATASHAVNDFRKICNIDAISPFDNVSEMTARINDDGWDNSLVDWLQGAGAATASDFILFLSVGGGSLEHGVSMNLVYAINYSYNKGIDIGCIVGKKDGHAYNNVSYPVLIKIPDEEAVTPYTESFHSVLLHLIASHPLLKENQTKWESINE